MIVFVRKFFLLFSLLLFIPSVVLAEVNYYNEEHNFSILVDENYFQSSDESINKLTEDEKKNLLTVFFNEENKDIVMVSRIELNSADGQFLQNVLSEYSKESYDKKTIERYKNVFEVSQGTNLSNLEIDPLNKTITIQFSNETMKIWIWNRNVILEFFTTDNSFGLDNIRVEEKINNNIIKKELPFGELQKFSNQSASKTTYFDWLSNGIIYLIWFGAFVLCGFMYRYFTKK